MHIGMVVFGDLSSDFRVFREASALQEANHTVSIVASDRSGRPLNHTWSEFDVHSIPVDGARSLRLAYPLFWRRAAAALKTLPVDAYHAHDLDALWPAVCAARYRDVPLVYDSHELWTGQSSLVDRGLIRSFWSCLERRLVRRVDRVIAVSPSVGRALSQQYDIADDVAIVRNVPPYRPWVAGNRIRAQLGLDDNCVILLYQGGFLTDNGLAEQIAAMATVDGAALILLGSGPTEAELRRQVGAARLDDRVFFIPRVPFDELHAYTCSADVGLCVIKPVGRSFYYSLPNKLFEYLMAGLPVLACDSPEIRAVVEETGAGEVVDATDVGAIGERLRRLVASSELRAQYTASALKAAPSYSWEREADLLVELYADLAARETDRHRG